MIFSTRSAMVGAKLRRAAALAAIPVAGMGSIACGAIVSSSPVAVFTAASSGGTALTDGLENSSTTSDPTSLTLEAPGVIAGYLTLSSSSRSLYYLVPSTNSVSLVNLNSDGFHLQSSSTPVMGMVSSSGTLLGSQTRSGDGAHSDGTDVFYYNGSGGTPTVVPLPTSVLGSNASYSYTDANDSYTSQTMTFTAPSDSATGYATNLIQSNGVIVGTVSRVAGNSYTANPGSGLGTDGFYYDPSNPTVSTAVGLTGAQYEYNPSFVTNSALKYHFTVITGLANGAAVGFTQRYDGTSAGNSLGYDGWMYTPGLGTSVQIGLVGGAYSVNYNGNTYEETQTFRTNTAGQIAGKSYQPSSTGSFSTNYGDYAWIYTPSATPGTASGFGTSSAGTYAQLGLTSSPSGSTLGYVNPVSTSAVLANSNIAFLTNRGTAAGTQNRFDTSGTTQGLAAIYYDGVSSHDITPSITGVHSAVSGGTTASSNSITAMTSQTAGGDFVAGYTTRYSGTTGGTALGQDAWIYDSSQNTPYWVDPTDESQGTGNYELSYIGAISPTGEAVGYYNTYSGTSSTVLSSNLFVWSEANGLQLLATYTGSSAASSMAAYTTSFEFDAAGDVFGPNTYGSGATSIVEYTAVPEPASLGLLGMGALGVLCRRRRA